MAFTFEDTMKWSRAEEPDKEETKKKPKLSVYSVATGAVIFGLPLAVIGIAWMMGKGSDEEVIPTRRSSRPTPRTERSA